MFRRNAVPIESLPAQSRREIEAFLRQYPLSPAGRLRPKMGMNNAGWYALLGPSLRDGKVGYGATPVTALRDFNRSFGRSAEPEPTA